jgi:4-hydroxybenzoate polyprenyltransferase
MRRLIREPAAAPGGPGPRVVARALLVELRPVQWVKNLACLAGLIFSGRLFVARSEAHAALGFWSFCFASSAVYILNDYLDREKDRLNPRTASRPLASGDLPVGVAAAAFLALVAAALAGAAFLGPPCVLVIATYGLMNVFYSMRLKEIVIADVMCIALGFVLRVLFGVYAVGVLPTPWIALCMFFLALFLGFAKRRAELSGLAKDSAQVRPVLAKYDVNYLNMLLVMSATTAVLCYALFTVASHKNPTLIVTVVPVVYCVNRYLLQVVLYHRGASPDKILLSDKRLWVGIGAWLLAYIAITYGNIQLFSQTGDWHTG